jgi:hypothetical protein
VCKRKLGKIELGQIVKIDPLGVTEENATGYMQSYHSSKFSKMIENEIYEDSVQFLKVQIFFNECHLWQWIKKKVDIA